MPQSTQGALFAVGMKHSLTEAALVQTLANGVIYARLGRSVSASEGVAKVWAKATAAEQSALRDWGEHQATIEAGIVKEKRERE